MSYKVWHPEHGNLLSLYFNPKTLQTADGDLVAFDYGASEVPGERKIILEGWDILSTTYTPDNTESALAGVGHGAPCPFLYREGAQLYADVLNKSMGDDAWRAVEHRAAPEPSSTGAKRTRRRA